MKWFLATRHMVEPADVWKPLLSEHFPWLQHQHDSGTVVMSGPSSDMTLGLLVLRAPDLAAARDIAGGDPLLRSRGATVEVVEWQLHQVLGVGSFALPPS